MRMLDFSQFDFGQFDFGQLAEVEIGRTDGLLFLVFFSFFFFLFLFLSSSSSFSSDSAFSFCSVFVFVPEPRTLNPELDPPLLDSPKFRSLFSLSRHSFHSFLPLLGVISLNFDGVLKAWT